MDAKVALTALIGILISHSSGGAPPESKKYSSSQYFKNYAMSTCISDGYSSQEVKNDAAAAARGYLEFGSFPLEAHTEATLLARKYLERSYGSSGGESMVLAKCIDFFHSPELQRLVAKYSQKRG